MSRIPHDSYMSTPPEMSGSLAKNRFRVELLWGLEKLLACLDDGVDDFAVVFDYRCDIELHLEEGYEFYQVKTSKASDFSVSKVCRKPSKGAPIIARLYELHDAGGDGNVRMAIVSNRPFAYDNGKLSSPGEVLVSSLSDKDKKSIEKAIGEACSESGIEYENISYIMVALDLDRPDDAIRGHLISTFKKVRGCEPRKPGALYESLSTLAAAKACEESAQPTYQDVIDRKAITSSEVSELFSIHEDKAGNRFDLLRGWVKTRPPLKRAAYYSALSEIQDALMYKENDRILLAADNVLSELDEDMSEDDIVETVAEAISGICGIEVNREKREVYAALALFARIEEK